MAVYLGMYIIIFLNTFFVGKLCPDEKGKKILAFMNFFTIFLMYAMRHPTMGADLNPYGAEQTGYLPSYNKIALLSWKEILFGEPFLNYERGYVVYNKLLSYISAEWQFLIGCTAAVSLLPVGYVIGKDSDSPGLSTLIYLGLPLTALMYSGLRQDMAIGICFFSFLFVKEKKPIPFVLLVLLASVMHTSALLFLAVYPAYHFPPLTQRIRWASVAILGVTYLFRVVVFQILCRILGRSGSVTSTNSFVLLLVFVGLYIMAFLFTDDSKEQNGLMNLFYIACFCQVFASVNSLAMRTGFYFMIFLPLLLPKVLSGLDVRYRVLGTAGVGLCFCVYGLIMLHSGGYSMSYPYYFFWNHAI